MSEHTEVLLPNASYYGTLAAARSLGRAGVEVTIADADRFAPASASRYVAHAVSCPDLEHEPERFLSWLVDYGARHPGAVLHPTSDEAAWLFARHRDELARSFRLYVPSFEAIDRLVNKHRLYLTCVELGIDAPETRRCDEGDLAIVEHDARFPLMLKPQTQAFLTPHQKGRIVRDAASLRPLAADLRGATRYAPMMLAADPAVGAPVAQAFYESAVEGIYNLSGFVDETGELFVVAASRKVLQWPRRLGIGLCFEEADVAPDAASAIARLCRATGYFGAFEVEFIEAGGRRLLIDFNPRFYGQMGFEVARGLDLPGFTLAAATGDRAHLRALVDHARAAVDHNEHRIYTNRIELEITLGLLRLAGAMTGADGARWRPWADRGRALSVDAVLDPDDRLPSVTAAISSLARRLAHPRSTWRGARAA